MTYAYAGNVIGIPDVTTYYTSGLVGSPWVGTTNDLPSVTVAAQLGMVIDMWDATLGQAKAILLKVPTSTTTTAGLLYQWDKNYTVVVVPALATSKTTGVAVAVALASAASNTTLVQYGWFLIQGIATTLKTAAAVAPQVPISISTTAGRVVANATVGGTILGARSQNTASITSTTSTVSVYFNFSAIEGK